MGETKKEMKILPVVHVAIMVDANGSSLQVALDFPGKGEKGYSFTFLG